MENQNTNNLFSRYNQRKIMKFNNWINTPHGREVYGLFKRFAAMWKQAGHAKCSASLITNRLRWECAIRASYQGYKITNDYSPMLARQLVQDDPSYTGFFSFHSDPSDPVAVTREYREGK